MINPFLLLKEAIEKSENTDKRCIINSKGILLKKKTKLSKKKPTLNSVVYKKAQVKRKRQYNPKLQIRILRK